MYVFQLVILLFCVSSSFPFSKEGKGENTNIHVYKVTIGVFAYLLSQMFNAFAATSTCEINGITLK